MVELVGLVLIVFLPQVFDRLRLCFRSLVRLVDIGDLVVYN